jgi:exosortase/archaeosortase family protein
VFFLAILFIILVFPQIFYSFLVGEEASARYTQILLANPTSGLLNVFGIETTTYIESNTAMIQWGPGMQEKVGITEACSGIYTTSIFISAFITYILVEYQKINLKVIIILVIGIFTSYLANILRMAIITGIGKLYGTEALLSAHANAGWLIFLAWIIPFWYLIFNYLIVDEEGKPTTASG